jgi:sulfoxide reductase heme-binding subunit YedZ
MKAWISENISNYWNDYKRPLASILHPLVHVGSIIPLLVGMWDFWQNNLGANPILEITHRSGKTAIILLMLPLSISPLRILIKWPQINKLRRPLGLYAFAYAALHFSIFMILDYGFNVTAVLEAIALRKFILFGFTAGLILLILAITSWKPLLKKLGKRWKPLHRFVYAAGLLAALHFIMAVKPGVLRPWYYAAVMLLLLGYRIPGVQTWIKEKI